MAPNTIEVLLLDLAVIIGVARLLGGLAGDSASPR